MHTLVKASCDNIIIVMYHDVRAYMIGIVMMQDHKTKCHPSYTIKVHHDRSCTLISNPPKILALKCTRNNNIVIIGICRLLKVLKQLM